MKISGWKHLFFLTVVLSFYAGQDAGAAERTLKSADGSIVLYLPPGWRSAEDAEGFAVPGAKVNVLEGPAPGAQRQMECELLEQALPTAGLNELSLPLTIQSGSAYYRWLYRIWWPEASDRGVTVTAAAAPLSGYPQMMQVDIRTARGNWTELHRALITPGHDKVLHALSCGVNEQNATDLAIMPMMFASRH